MSTNPEMPKPVDAPLLIDDPEHGDRDERCPGVHLLEVDADGEGKTTAERVDGGWKIADWELTDELDGALAGSRYWFCRCWHTVPDVHVDKLAAIRAAKLPAPAAGDPDPSLQGLPTEWRRDVQAVVDWLFRVIGPVEHAYLLTDDAMASVRRLEKRLAVVGSEEPVPSRDALLSALAEYPKRNTHQLQAAKVCAGVITLATTLEEG